MCLSSVRVFSSACHPIQRPALKPNTSNENHTEHISNYVLSEIILFRYLFRKQQAAHFKRLFHRKLVDTQSTASVTAKNKSASLFTYIFVLTFRGLHLFFFFLLSLASQEFITRLMLRYSDHSGYTENSVISFP